MIFRTELEYQTNELKLDYNSKIFTIGSCFATEIAQKLIHYKFNTYHNPFGILFHPLAIENALMRIYSNQEYISSEIYKYEELYISWDHSSTFDSVNAETILNQINKNIQTAHDFLRNTDLIIITLGTSWIYKLKQFDIIVANCHKIPNSNFNKLLLTENQIKTSLKNIVEMLNDLGKDKVKILFTLSPVRHIKDGLVENNRSKAQLLSAIHSVVDLYDNCEYFPAYEFIMDDLRDYRFYKEDLVHPNEVAIQYIWNKFKNSFMSNEVESIMQRIDKIKLSLQHKAQNESTIAHKKFLYNILKNIQDLEPLLPKGSMQLEYHLLKNRIENT